MMHTQAATFDSYANARSKNNWAQCLRFVDAGGNQYWFSYRTLVAFKPYGRALVVAENQWGPTQGKHLDAIDGKRGKRLPMLEFLSAYVAAFPSGHEATMSVSEHTNSHPTLNGK